MNKPKISSKFQSNLLLFDDDCFSFSCAIRFSVAYQLMLFKLVAIYECFVACRAIMSAVLLPRLRMNSRKESVSITLIENSRNISPPVLVQIILPAEKLLANVAVEHFLAGVGHNVTKQMLLSTE